MTMNLCNNAKIDESFANTELYAKCSDISALFKKLKSKGILNETFVVDTYKLPEELLQSKDFIDKVIYYRMKRHYTPAQFAKKIGLNPDTYYQYENRTFKLHNTDTIEKIVEVLEIGEENLPEYVKFIKSNPIEKLKKYLIDNNITVNCKGKCKNVMVNARCTTNCKLLSLK